MKILTSFFSLVTMSLVPWAASLGHSTGNLPYTKDFPLAECNFVASSTNPYFPLPVGRVLYYNNQRCVNAGNCDEIEELWITVTPDVRSISLQIDGELKTVDTRVLQERETADGQLVEISRNFFATCQPGQDVYYFGEAVNIYENGEVISHDGAWLAGRRQALPGIIMPGGAFLLGSRYYQELAPGVALDRAKHVATGLRLRVPAGNFENCARIIETSPLEPGAASTKVYCPGVGLVIDNELELVMIDGQ